MKIQIHIDTEGSDHQGFSVHRTSDGALIIEPARHRVKPEALPEALRLGDDPTQIPRPNRPPASKVRGIEDLWHLITPTERNLARLRDNSVRHITAREILRDARRFLGERVTFQEIAQLMQEIENQRSDLIECAAPGYCGQAKDLLWYILPAATPE